MSTYKIIEGVRMAEIPSGSYMMGHDYKPDPSLPANINKYYPDEQPVHKVSVKAFQLGATPVTQGEYEKLMGDNPATFKGENLPITNMGAGNVEIYCNKLSRAAGFEPVYDEKTRAADFSKNGFRLPTEEEWEYSCRAGTQTFFNTGNTERDLDRAGWYNGNSGGRTHPVGQKESNAWGLYDMHGNVFEFCEDNWIPAMCYGRYLVDEDPNDLTYNYYHDLRVTRGGSWIDEASICRSATRSCFCNWPWIRQSYYIGFRVARNV
ncbi:formylglycine-generating enzyme family protein [Candidatus Latescibacterota bacterium]